MWVSMALLVKDDLAVEILGVSIYTAAMTKWEKCSGQEIIRAQSCLHWYFSSWAEIHRSFVSHKMFGVFLPSNASIGWHGVTFSDQWRARRILFTHLLGTHKQGKNLAGGILHYTLLERVMTLREKWCFRELSVSTHKCCLRNWN